MCIYYFYFKKRAYFAANLPNVCLLNTCLELRYKDLQSSWCVAMVVLQVSMETKRSTKVNRCVQQELVIRESLDCGNTGVNQDLFPILMLYFEWFGHVIIKEWHLGTLVIVFWGGQRYTVLELEDQ